MSRATVTKVHCMQANEFEGLRNISKDAEVRKSANRVEMVTIEGPGRWHGTFFQKFYEQPRLAKLEATLLLLQGVRPEDIAICVIDGRDTLLTRHNHMTSIADAFEEHPRSLKLDHIKHQPSEILLRSLVSLLVFDLFWKNPDRHVGNLGFSPEFCGSITQLQELKFIGIDLDGIEELINHKLKEARSEWVNTSSAGCFDVTASHFDKLFTNEDHTLPSFHPFQPNVLQIGNHNAYSPTMCEFFNQLRVNEHFEPLLLEEIVVLACGDDSVLQQASKCFQLPSEDHKLLLNFMQKRQSAWMLATQQSKRIRNFLLEPGNLQRVKQRLGADPSKIIQLDTIIQHVMTPRIVAASFKSIADIIRENKINLPATIQTITTLNDLVQHKWPINEAIDELTKALAALTKHIPKKTQNLCASEALFNLARINHELTKLIASLTTLSEDYAVEATPEPVQIDELSSWADDYTGLRPDTVWVAGNRPNTDLPTELHMSVMYSRNKGRGDKASLSTLEEIHEDLCDEGFGSLPRDPIVMDNPPDVEEADPDEFEFVEADEIPETLPKQPVTPFWSKATSSLGELVTSASDFMPAFFSNQH